jgi:hypothetical protein
MADRARLLPASCKPAAECFHRKARSEIHSARRSLCARSRIKPPRRQQSFCANHFATRAIGFKSRSAPGHASADSVDDIPPPARTWGPPTCVTTAHENARSCRSFPSSFAVIFCWGNDKKSPSDIASRRRDPADSRLLDCGSTKTSSKVFVFQLRWIKFDFHYLALKDRSRPVQTSS